MNFAISYVKYLEGDAVTHTKPRRKQKSSVENLFMPNRVNHSLWWFSGVLGLKTYQRQNTNTSSIPFPPLLSLSFFPAGSELRLIKAVKHSKAPKLPQQPEGLSGGRNDSRLRVCTAGWYGSANTQHLTLKVQFSLSRQSQWFLLWFRHLHRLKLLRIISRGIWLEIEKVFGAHHLFSD